MEIAQEGIQVGPIQTEGVPGIYSNHAAVSISFSEIRLYFAEVMPKSVATTAADKGAALEPNVVPRVCIILNPEFAKALRDAIVSSVTQYETRFGALRAVPQVSPPDTPAKP